MSRRTLGILTLAVLALAPQARGQVRELAEMNAAEIRQLDRARTAVIVTGGILEQHGPYLPSYADGYANEALAARLARAIVARPGWTALMFPPIPLGVGGANEIGGHRSFPGTYALRAETFRDVFMDLAAELGEQGFRHVFVVHGHGSPPHNAAIDTAGDWFHHAYGGRMVHLLGLMDAIRCCETVRPLASAEAWKEDGFSVHGGVVEHSSLLFHRPDLVPESIRQAPSITGTDFAQLVTLASAPDWPGYFGAPRHASAALGAADHEGMTALVVKRALEVLDGADPSAWPRYADWAMSVPPIAGVVERTAEHEAKVRQRQQDWLRGRTPARK